MMRVLIVAASAISLSGLESVLRASGSFEVVRTIADFAVLAESVEELQPDVVVAEVTGLERALPDELLKLLEEAPVGVVLLVDDASAERDIEALRSGVRAVVQRNMNPSAIVAAVEAVGAGFAVLAPEELQNLLRETGVARRTVAGAVAAPLVEALTPREMEVLGMMVEGWGNKEISTRLKISEHTVKFHVASIMGKLNAGSRTEAVTLGIRHGLVML
jgi:NarL family two-component system response regulator YdfI